MRRASLIRVKTGPRKPIAIAAAIGFVVALPVSWLVARKIETLTAPKG